MPPSSSTLSSSKAPQLQVEALVIRTTWVGLALNLLLAALKFVLGTLGHSQAVVADAVHSLSDTASDIAILIGVRYWSAPADHNHPHGHQRIETIVTALIGLLLAAVAFGLIAKAVLALHAGAPSVRPSLIALAAALISVVVKEGLYQWTAHVGRRVKSSALTANAWHHRSDALSSIPTALAVAGASIGPEWFFLDAVGAVVVTLFILQASWRIMRPALNQLADTGASREDCGRIRLIVLDFPGVRDVHAVRTRYIGSALQVDLHMLVDGDLSVQAGHDMASAVKRQLIEKGPDISDVVIHIEPYGPKK